MTYAVIGCGVRGSVAAAMLTAAGVDELSLVDGGSVSEEDFGTHPLLFRPDLGASRADALVTKLALIDPGVHVQPFPAYIDEQNVAAILAGMDCVLDCRGGYEDGGYLAAACAELGITVVEPPRGYDPATASTPLATAVGALQAELALQHADRGVAPVVRVEGLSLD